MSPRPRALFLSNRPARDTTSGPLLMHRHLRALGPSFELLRAHPCEALPDDAPFSRLPVSDSFLRALRSPRLAPWARAFDLLRGWAISRRFLFGLVRQQRPDLLLTVAESPLLRPVTAVANTLRVPLVTVVHDWSPVWEHVPARLRPWVDRRFAADCNSSTLSLCVSDELVQRLGGGPRLRVLHPIPEERTCPPRPPKPPFHSLYTGVFHHFQAEEMGGLCGELSRRGRPDLLRVFGLEPDWNQPSMSAIKAGGFYRGLLNRSAIQNAFDDAGALLVICPFASHLDAFARYSFPSKLTEYLQHGRPIVLWGPKYAAAITWALRHNAALVVTSQDPRAAADALERVSDDERLRLRLTEDADRNAAAFAPRRLQQIFEQGLLDALSESRSAKL